MKSRLSRKLINQLELGGCMVTADALYCQKKTAHAIIEGNADYLLCAKDNQETLKQDIEDYVQGKVSQEHMERKTKTEKSRNRIEKRTAYCTDDIDWQAGKNGKDCGVLAQSIQNLKKKA